MTQLPTLPKGFVLETAPPLPPGFTTGGQGAVPPPPPGFVLDATPPTEPPAAGGLTGRIEDIIGGGGNSAPMNDEAALDSDAMRDAGSGTWGQLAQDTAIGAGNVVNFIGRGAGQGLEQLFGLPNLLGRGANWLMENVAEKAGVPEHLSKLVGMSSPASYLPSYEDMEAVGADVNQSVADLFGVEPPRGPQTRVERMSNRIGEEAGPAMIPVLGNVAKYGGRGLEAVAEASRLARFFGAGAAATNPAVYAGREAAFATAAGLGAGTANEIMPGSAWADFGGAVTGAGALGVGSAVGKAGADVGRAIFSKGSFQDEVVRDAVMNDIASAAGIATKPGEAPDITPIINATEGPRVSDVIPGYQETLADRTKIPGLAALEYSRQSGPNSGMYTASRARNTEAIDNAMAPIEPQGTPGQFSSELEAARNQRIAEAEAQTVAARTAYDEATSSLAPVMTGEGRGANIRTALEDASDAAQEIVAKAWAPINQAPNKVDMAPLADTFGQVRADTPAALQPLLPGANAVPEQLVSPATPAEPTGLLDASGSPIMRPEQPAMGEQPLSEVMGIRSALTNELRRTGITPQERRLIEQHVSRLDSYLDANIPENLRGQYDSARNATRDYHDRFTRPQSAIGQTLAEREGRPRGPDNAVARKFVQSDQGRIADFEALMREAGSDNRVRTAVRDQVLQDVRDRGLMENPEALRSYLDQYDTVFKKFPDLKGDLGNAGSLRAQLDEAAKNEQQLRTMLTQSNKSTVAHYLSYGDEKADQAMKGVLASRDPAASIDELLTFVGDAPKAVEGARKVFWDIMQTKSRAGGRTTSNIDGRQPWSPRALADFLDNPTNAAVAQRLYRDNPEHLENVRSIAEALKGVELRNAAKAPNSSGTPQGLGSQLLTPEAIQSRAYAYFSGRISGTFLVTSIASVFARRSVLKAQQQGYQRMMDDILLDADAAALLMRENNPAARQALAKKAKGWWGAEASKVLNALSAEDPDENEPIMREGK